MAQDKTFKEQMLDKYPSMNKVTNCSVCHADLQYLMRIHRIGMKWYCNKCFIKYRRQNMKSLNEIVEENKKADVKIPDDKIWKEVNELLDTGDMNAIATELYELKRELYKLRAKQ